MSELQPGDVVRVQLNKQKGQWSLATVIKRVKLCSYLVKGNGKVCRYYNKFLRLTKKRYISDFDYGFNSIIGRNLRNDVNGD